MHYAQLILLLATMAVVALAAPMSEPKINTHIKSFSVPRTRKADHVRNPTKAMNRAYRKYGWKAAGANTNPKNTVELTDSSETTVGATTGVKNYARAVTTTTASASSNTSSAEVGDDSGEVKATPADSGAEYLSEVTIGGQKLTLNFDTGSADLWVFSTHLSSSDIGQHSAYDSSKSSNYSSLAGATFEISYGDNSGASGIVGFDTVDIGGATVTRQAIELATSVSSAFVEDVDADGLVGLAFSSLNSIRPRAQKTFFENVMDSLIQPLFTADLDKDGSGTYEFGVIDPAKYKGELTFVPIDTSSGFWQFESAEYTIAGVRKNNTKASPAIADTGTSLMLLDPDVVTDYYSHVPGAEDSSSVGGWIYPCDTKLPDFGISIGGAYMANLTGSAITYAKVSTSTCFGGIQSNGGSGQQILGDVLLQQHFTVFHGEHAMIGMANKA